ncbi:patatin-like phospholipase family protein [Dongia deserti]|uniref:patatin-like phospholipase family protein n=1 Tax=Dongia deserti TaxID=2268030 RepID=UPI0013C417A8|nr:patatin-like phospholipase family protein [Dongia deserti]
MPARISARTESVILVFSGGVALGAYQAGTYEALLEDGSVRPSWFAASSVGAVNAALIAGSAPGAAIASLRRFWTAGANPSASDAVSFAGSTGRHAWSWMSAIGARLAGAPGFFYPRIPVHPLDRATSLYDLAPTRAKLETLVDFDRLNAGEIRITVAATDIESGECVLFDTARGDRITCDHLLASSGFLPEFAPVEIGGRLIGDGGLSANAPIEPVFDEPDRARRPIFILDLFARDGGRPADLAESLARRNDLIFGNQTLGRLKAYQKACKAAGDARRVFYLSYRAPRHEAGPERLYDFSRRTIEERWQAGRLDMVEALRQLKHGRARDADTIIARHA